MRKGSYKVCCYSNTGAGCFLCCWGSNCTGVCGSGCYPLVAGSCPCGEANNS
ncbi:MAG: hypothetical protein M1326_03020 [Cyanobacteria bacterium]|nr:hypothetical protein [Cyanobacteriota bacterium]